MLKSRGYIKQDKVTTGQLKECGKCLQIYIKKSRDLQSNIDRESSEAVREIPAAELVRNNGLWKIIQKLDSLFLKDENTQAHNAFKAFHHFKRSSGGRFADFMIQFVKLHNRLVWYNMAKPEAFRAFFFLLNAANMT